MSHCQQFKQAFLSQCAAAGLTTDDMQKLAGHVLSQLHNPFDKSASMLDWFLIPPVVAGGAAGYGAAKIRGLYDRDEDPAEFRDREKIDALRLATRQAKLRSQLREQQMQPRATRPLLR